MGPVIRMSYFAIVSTAGSVLLVGEDDAFDMYAEFLRAHDFSTTVKQSPDLAIEDLAQVHPAVVVTDFVFGRSTRRGCDFIAALREHPVSREIPIIVVSGYVRDEDRQQARQCGADRFFMKPWLPDALLEEVQHAALCHREGRRPTWNGPPITRDRRKGPRRHT
jgi:two-component system cell cycle response regulator DivK